jgi:hypothetical protein
MTLKIFRIFELHEYSFMAVFRLVPSDEFDTTDLNVFVCSDDLLCRESTANCTPGQEVGRYVLCDTTSDPISVIDDLPEFNELPDFTIYPNRVLETIASVADMSEYTADPGINKNGYYRADTVAMIFNTEHLMNKVIDMVTRDVRLHVRATEGVQVDTELINYSEITDDDLRSYYFRG